MAQSNWEADKMLDVYIHDYLVKKKLHASAKAFMTEGKVATDPVAIDAPGGFLFEWWSVFWDIFIARTNDKHSEAAAAYIEAQQMKTREQQQMQMQQQQVMQQRNAQLQRRDPSHPSLSGPINAMNSEGMLGQSSASVLAMRMYEERMKQPHGMDSEASPALMDPSRMALLKSGNPQGPIVQGNSGAMPASLQQIQQRTHMTTDIKTEPNLGATQKSLPMDPSSIYGQPIMSSKSGLSSAGLNQGVTGPLKGWPLTGIDQIRPSLGVQGQKTGLQAHNQFILSQQHQALAQAQAQGMMVSSANYGDVDPRRFNGLPRGNVNAKDGQSTRNEGSICSPVQSNSPKMKMSQVQQSSSQQDQLQQQQLQQNNRKRKQSSSGPANSTGTGNTVGPSPNSPPSTHTPGDGVTTSSTLKHVKSVSKSLMMYAPEGTGGLASSSNLLEDIEHFGDVGSLEDNVESFLSHDGGDGRDLYSAMKQSPTEHKKETSKGFTFDEVGCIRTKNNKVTCCHFSSNGKLLASAGHEKKAVLWNMDTLETESTPADHKYVITDIRFRPNSSQLITASYDCSVRLWDAANPNYALHAYTHRAPVMSVDFHPKKTDLFCFCDNNNEIHYWNMNPFSFSRFFKGGTAQVRFQPRIGQLLAAASGELVSIFDVETDRQTLLLQGHSKAVNYVCWDEAGDYLASVSQDSVKVWSVASGECIHELPSTGTEFHSCVFHPSYSTLLVIGGVSSLELWNMPENRRMSVSAHENIIAALAQSPAKGMVASASHDSFVKLWK